MIASLVCLLLLQSPTITLTQTAVPLPQLLKIVGSQVGANLQCTTSLKNDIVAVRLDHCSLADFKTQLATAECADWSKDGSVDYINLSPQKEKAAEEAYWASVVAAVEKSLKQDMADDSSNPGTSGAATQGGGGALGAAVTAAMDPNSADLNKAILAIGVANVVQTGPYHRLVFSNKPTATQIQMPVNAEQIIESKIIPTLASQEVGEKSTAPVAKYDLSVSTQIDSAYVFQLDFYAENGATVGSVSTYASGEFNFLSSSTLPTQPTPAEPTHKITLSPDTQLVVTNSSLMGMLPNASGDKGDQYEKYKALVAHPSTVDPLTWVSDAYNVSATALDKNLIAVLPDSASNLSNILVDKGLTAEKIFKSSKQFGILKTEEGNWIRLRPSNPDQARESQVGRDFLQNLVDYELAHPKPDIVALSQIAAKMGSQLNMNNVVMGLITPFRPGWLTQFFMQSFDLLALYGNLTDEQRNQLESGGTLSLQSLSNAAQNQIAVMLYSKSAPLTVMGKAPVKDDLMSMMAEMSDMFGQTAPGTSAATGFKSEPTEVCPSGLPSQTNLKAQSSNEKVYEMVPDKSAPKEMAMAADQLGLTANQLAMFFSMPDDAAQDQMKYISGFKPGSRQSLNIRIFVSNDEFLSGSIHNDFFDPSATAETMDAFKKDNKASIDKFKGIWDKLKQEGQMSDGSQGTTPP